MSISVGSSTASSNVSQLATNLFSKLDTKNQGYLDESDLESAFAQLTTNGSSSSSSSTSSTSSTSDADAVFKQLDSNGDGKVTPEELAAGLQKVSDQLDSHFHNARMHHHHHSAQGADDGGLTQDQLTSLAQTIGAGGSASDTSQASNINNLVANFDKADANHDGKISVQEAQAFDKASSVTSAGSSSASTSSDASNNGSSSSQTSDASIIKRILQLVQAYGNTDQSTTPTALTSSISAIA